MTSPNRLPAAAIYTGLTAGALITLVPFALGLLTSLTSRRQFATGSPLQIPRPFTLANYGDLAGAGFGRAAMVTALMTAVILVGQLTFSVLAAYAFARFPFPGRGALLAAFLAVNMFSGAVLLIPLYRLMRAAGLLNTYWAMIVPGVAFLIPTATWLLRTYMMRIPRELDEAAWVDGASRLYTLRRVILPIAMPGIMVVAITTFIGAYAQQFIFALTFNSKTEYMPLSIGLFAYFGRQEVVWNELMAASFVGIAPVMIVIFFLQRYLVAGLTAGAVKQ